MLKYKVGDKAVISGDRSSHGFKMRTILTITELFLEGTPPHYYTSDKNGDSWYVREGDLSSC
jgi:hypothetical protein